MSYVHLSMSGVGSASMTPESYDEAERTWLCRGCGFPKPGIKSVDVVLQTRPQKPLDFPTGVRVGLIHRPFLNRFPASLVTSDLYLGTVFRPSGKIEPDWVTLRGRRRVLIRGTEQAGYRVCDLCGQICYFALGKKYLYPEPPQDATLIEARIRAIAPYWVIWHNWVPG